MDNALAWILGRLVCARYLGCALVQGGILPAQERVRSSRKPRIESVLVKNLNHSAELNPEASGRR